MKGFVYGIINSENQIIYVGSTRQRLFCMRKGDHTKPNKTKEQPVHKYINENGGWTKFNFKILEECDIETIKELLEKERYYYDLYKPITNIVRPITSDDERRIYLRDKAKHFRETHPQYHLRYIDKQKERDKARCSITVECSCGKSYKAQNKSHHIKTKYHIDNAKDS